MKNITIEFLEDNKGNQQVIDLVHDIATKAKTKDGFDITLVDIVKELTYHQPLLENRVNWRPVGAFRAVFFYETDTRSNQILYFTKAVIKDNDYSEAFESIVAESEIMMNDFYTKRSD